MPVANKLSSGERRTAIIQAVRRVFAEKGFHGTTTRELAKAAGVSEALLFKHFPNKEALYLAMMRFCCQEKNPEMAERMNALEPSTSTLVLLVHLLATHLVGGNAKSEDEDLALQPRLQLRSLSEDGEFARLFLERATSHWMQKVEESIEAAIAAGDAVPGPATPNLRAWFMHHLAAMVMIHLLPPTPAVDYGASREKLVEPVVWFALRGMGLKDEAIKRHYNPRTL